MPDIQIRWMAPEELGRLADIDRSERVRLGYRMEEGQLVAEEVDWHVPNFLREGHGPHSLSYLIASCAEHLAAGGRMIGAFDGDKLVGIGILTPEVRPAMAQLAFLHVSQGYRRAGIGGRLTEEMLDYAAGLGARQVYVSATPSASAVGFYLGQGFRPTQEPLPELFELEPEDIHMVKEL
jgi:predicted N-acetyltransferase YhbS